MAQAEHRYREILAAEPAQFDALHYLGILNAQCGRLEEALRLVGAALKINPQSVAANASYGNLLKSLNRPVEALQVCDRILAIEPHAAMAHYNRGNALLDLGRHGEALQSYERALVLAPGTAAALYNRGNVLQQLNRHDEALASYDELLEQLPDHPAALYNRGVALQALGRHEEALASYERALINAPDDAALLTNRGITLHELKRHEEALASYDRALAADPHLLEALNNKGNLLRELQRPDEALMCCERALAVKPDYVAALINRGNVLQALRRDGEALAAYNEAMSIAPDDADVMNNRGTALADLGRWEEALASYDAALATQSGHADAHSNRGTVLIKLKRPEEAIACFERALAIKPDYPYAEGAALHCKMLSAKWDGYSRAVEQLTAGVRSGKRCVDPFVFLGISTSAADQLLCSRIAMRDKHRASPMPLWKGERYRHDRIRIAYVSADLHEHPVAHLLAGLFSRHDRSRFETVAISLGPDQPGEMRTRLQGSFDQFIDLGHRSDADIAGFMRELEIDIAVDLMGITQNARTGIFRYRPAPVQVSYLGYAGTIAAECFDYVIADRTVIPEDQQPHYAEKVVYLPDTFQVNDDTQRIAEDTPTRAEAGLPAQGFVFCSFNNVYKITPDVFDIWMRILRKVAGSILWLQPANDAAARNLRSRALERGVEAARIVFAPRADRLEDHLARYRLADLFFDTLPYNAHTTATDALWSGLPVLTCAGTTFAGRVAASLLNALGLPQLITTTLEEYEQIALRLATDDRMLAELKTRLALNRASHALFNTDRFRRHIESAYLTMWERTQRGEAPRGFGVQATSGTDLSA